MLESVTAPTKKSGAEACKPDAVTKARASLPAKKAMLADILVLRASHGMEGRRD